MFLNQSFPFMIAPLAVTGRGMGHGKMAALGLYNVSPGSIAMELQGSLALQVYLTAPHYHWYQLQIDTLLDFPPSFVYSVWHRHLRR